MKFKPCGILIHDWDELGKVHCGEYCPINGKVIYCPKCYNHVWDLNKKEDIK